MKKLLLGCLMLGSSLAINAQIKVFPSGNVALGQLNGESINTRLKVVGNSLFTSSIFLPISAAYIRGNEQFSTASNPDYTWYNNDQTGIFHPQGDVIGFSIAGQEHMRLNQFGNLQMRCSNTQNFSLLIGNANNTSSTIASFSNHSTDYAYGITSYVNRDLTKAFVVVNNAIETFCVLGNGTATSMGRVLRPELKAPGGSGTVIDALDRITSLQTFSNLSSADKIIGLTEPELAQWVPEAVVTVDKRTYIDYDVVTALLVESVKAQQKQILSLVATVNKLKNSVGLGTGLTQQNSIDLAETLALPSDYEQIPMAGQSSANPLDAVKLLQNNPNPFNQTTTIAYALAANTQTAQLLVFDMQGGLKLTKTLGTQAGKGSAIINANELNSGMYLYSLVVNGQEVDTKRMILTK